MSSHYRKHAAVIGSLLFVCLFGSGGDLEAQTGIPTPAAQTPAAPTKSEDTSDDSEPKVQNYQLKHAKAAEVLKIWKQIHGIVNGVSVDERTNSIVYVANDEAARELRESLDLLDSETPIPIVPPTPVVPGSSQQAPVPAKSKPAGPFRKFTFKHAKVADVVKILREVTGASIDNENMEGFAVDERTNSVIWKVKDEWESRHWEETLLTLDGDSSASKTQKTPSPYRPTDDNRAEGISLSFQTLTISMEFDPSSTVESLKQRYNEREQQAHQLADKLKQSKSPRESERSELHAAVRKSFEARQALQRAELADLVGRMKSMQQSIDLRDKLADKVVQRRVEDLLNPNLKWDTTPSQVPKSLVADEPQNSDSTSPSLSSTQAAVTRLLARLPHFATPQGDVATAPIAFLGIDYQGPWSLGDFREELQKEIEAQISQSSSCSLVSRRMTESAMMEQRIKPTDVVTPEVQKKLTQSLRSLDMKVQGLMFARLKHLGDSDSTRNGEFEVSLELFDINLHNYNERATARNDRSSSDSRKKEPQLFQGRWIIESWSKESEDQLSIAENQFELRIEGYAIHVFDDVGNHHASMLLDEQNIEPAAYNGIACPVNYVIDPNGDRIVCPGILELDGDRLRICYSRNNIKGADSEKFRPSLFIPGSKVTLIECRRAPADAAKAAASNEPDLSMPSVMGQFGGATEVGSDEPKPSNTTESNGSSRKNEKAPATDDASANPSQPSSTSPAKFDTPQALLARLDEYGNNGSYEEFVSLFSDDGVRDLAGSLLVSAMQVTTMAELAKQNGGDLGQGPARIQKALNRWLKPNPTPEQQQAASEALSLMFLVGFGGPVQDESVITAYVAGLRKSAERVTDFRRFSVDMLNAYHELTGEPFGYFGKEADRKWQVTQSGNTAVATLVMKTEPTPATVGIGANKSEKYSTSNGSEHLPVMTLTKLDGTWRISSLFDELLNVVKPNIAAPSAAAPEQANSKMITRRYSVGSFVTESYFTGKGNYDTKEVYEKYETEIEQSLQDLAKTVTATCTQPPKFVQVISSSRCLLIGHTETGHQEIADFMSDIGISNDRIRLRGVAIEITSDEAKTLGIELTQRVLSSEESEKLREFQRDKKPKSENGSHEFNFVAMDETIQSGTQTHVKTSEVGKQFPFAARIIPGKKEVQVRMDFHGASGGVEFFAPRIQTLSDGESVLLVIGDDLFWLATADIVHDAIVEKADKAASNP